MKTQKLKLVLSGVGLSAALLTSGCFLDPSSNGIPNTPKPPIVPPSLPNCLPFSGAVKSFDLVLDNSESNAYIEVFNSEGKSIFASHVNQREPFRILNSGTKTFDRILDVFINGSYYTSIIVNGTQPLGPGYVNGDLKIVAAQNLKGSPICNITSTIDYITVCKPCDGKVKSLTLQYLGGESSATVKITDKSGSVLLTQQGISWGSMVSLTGAEKGGTLGTTIKLYLDGQLVQSIHTSCSIPLFSGMKFGDFELVRASSRNNGIICDLP